MLTPTFSGGGLACAFMHTVFLDFFPSQLPALTLVTDEWYVAIVYAIKEEKLVTKERVIRAY